MPCCRMTAGWLDKTTQEFTPIMLSKEAHGAPWVKDAPVDDTMLSAAPNVRRIVHSQDQRRRGQRLLQIRSDSCQGAVGPEGCGGTW